MTARRLPRLRRARSRDETDLVVWRVLVGVLRSLTRVVDGDALDALRAGSATLVAADVRAARVGTRPTDDGPRDPAAARRRCSTRSGRSSTTREVIARARETDDRPDTDADVVAACITIVASHGDAERFDEFVDRAGDAATPQEQLRYLYALGDVPERGARAARARELAIIRRGTPPERPVPAPARAAQPRARPARVGVRARPLGRDRGPVLPLADRRGCSRASTWLVDDASVVDVPALPRRAPGPRRHARHRAAPRTPTRAPRPRRPRARAPLGRSSLRHLLESLTFAVRGGRYRGCGAASPRPLLRARPGLVRDQLRRAHARAGAGLARDRGRRPHADPRAHRSGKTLAAFLWAIDRLGDDARARRRPSAAACSTSRRCARSRSTSRRTCARRSPGIALAAERLGVDVHAADRRDAHRRHAGQGAPAARAHAARHPDHHARVALPDAHVAGARDRCAASRP